MLDTLFHPAVAGWFSGRFEAPSAPQVPAWQAHRDGRHVLIAAPTGSGKTLAAFLAAIDDLVREGADGPLPDEARVLYVSPLKALSNDIEKNLREPLQGIGVQLLLTDQRPDHGIRVLVRTGDTPAHQRTAMVNKPPHIVVTTPESLFILLTTRKGQDLLRTVRTVIVDEIHALVGSKRGSHLSLSLERLEELTGGNLLRLGLSATQKPIEEVARFLVGTGHVTEDGTPDCVIVDEGHVRERDLAVEVPASPLDAVMSHEVWTEVYDRLVELIEQHRSTLVFVNTRRLAERVTRLLGERLGEDQVTSHHGSLSKEHRLKAEQRLKNGELKALVATASLELGIDVGDVDLVCQIGSTRSIAAFLQRVGRSGHFAGGVPKGRLFPLTRDELVESAALLDCIRRSELDRLRIPPEPLDILAQHLVSASADREWSEEELFCRVRRAWPYRDLSRKDFDDVVRMLAEGFATQRGRRAAYLHRDVIHRRVRGRRGARLAAVTSGGAIPDNADYQVLQEPAGTFVGTVNEDFAIESAQGDIFQLGNMSWRILRVEPGKLRVEDAQGAPPTIPFWFGEAPARTDELSAAVSRVRATVAGFLEERGEDGIPAAVRWLTDTVGLCEPGARQLVDYLAAGRATLGVMPTQEDLVLERFFDESGGMQLVLHSPHGARINRAWGLALRKRFCKKFNFELQAAATEDALLLSLGVTHSFPLAEVFHYLSAASVRDVLIQALLDAPMFQVRWRWNAGRALAVPRFQGGKKVPSPLLRMRAEDLLSVVFPDQVACFENIQGARQVPDHPLVNETLRDCLTEAMDIEGLEALLTRVAEGSLGLHARDVTEPSPLSLDILNARPYAFLDDAPLEERRTQAVQSRRWIDPATARDLGALDAEAIARVREEAWPDARDEAELHDALVLTGGLADEEVRREPSWTGFLDALVTAGRATRLSVGPGVWIAAERLPDWRAIHPGASAEPEIVLPPELADRRPDPETALVEIVRGRLEAAGPITAAGLATLTGTGAADVDRALLQLEGEGFVFRGSFTPGATVEEWCDRRLLARIHRYTLRRLRREIEPVAAADFLRYLIDRHDLAAADKPEGRDSLFRVLHRLEGFEAAAAAWEGDLLPARLGPYDGAWLDGLCLAGSITWLRLTPPTNLKGRSPAPVRSTPIALLDRRNATHWIPAEPPDETALGADAATVRDALRGTGALFFAELVQETGLLASRVEEALRELVARGVVTADGFLGLRALLVPAHLRKRALRLGRFDIREAGRWSVIRRPRPDTRDPEAAAEHAARVLLDRYGVVFRKLTERETLPPWRDLLRVYRRLEARGEIRGGRFVNGFSGEQYALPDAVDGLRAVRKRPLDGRLVSVSAADPLNLVGIIVPGDRVPALAGNRVLYRDGEAVAVRVGGSDRFLVPLEEGDAWEAKKRLQATDTPPRLRAYLGRRR